MKTYLFIFLITLIITLCIVILYGVTSIGKTDSNLLSYDVLDTFPDIRGPGVGNTGERNCSNTLYSCNNDLSCDTQCGNSDYTCTNVSQGEEVMYNGMKVGKGNWCLPKNKKGCGKYTGMSVWSDSEGGEWKCICKYPQLFDGEYCLNNKACKDFSEKAKNINQLENKLVDAQGNVWDPTLPNFIPPNGLSPLAKDKDGKPIFKCRCGGGYNITDPKNIYQFANLPNDPYYCHLDPCTPNSGSRTWDEENMTCNCGLDMEKDTDGLCITPTCPYGSWDKLNQRCACLGRTALVYCNSDKVRRNGINPNTGKKYPDCKDMKNENGMECIDRCIFDDKYEEGDCIDKTCKKCIGGTCIFSGEGGNSDISCNCGIAACVNTKGFCVKDGKAMGDPCYHGLDAGTYDNKELRLPVFWVWDDNATFNIKYINYDNEALQQLFGFLSQDALSGLAREKCKARCLGEIADPNEMTRIFNDDYSAWSRIKNSDYVMTYTDVTLMNIAAVKLIGKALIKEQNLFPFGRNQKIVDNTYAIGGVCGYASPCA